MPQEDGFVKRQGYWWKRDGSHPRSNAGYIKRSVLVLEEKLGRPLEPGEMVHHIDGDRGNDDPANLEITTRSKHMSDHIATGHIDTWAKWRKHLAQREKQVLQLWKEDWNTSQIREQMSIGGATLQRYLTKHGFNNGKRRPRKAL